MNDISSFSPLWGEWYIKDLVGQGSFGAVYRAEKKEYGNTYVSAVKHISIPGNGMSPQELIGEGIVSDMNSALAFYDSLRNRIIKEINVCYALRGNTNIVAYEDHCIIPKNDGVGYDIFIRMEYLTALNAYLSSHVMTEQDVIKLGIDICTALEVLNEKHLLHRDIKPANIFVNSSGVYKLGDFGEAKVLSGASVGMSIRGTYAYMSPEISQGSNANITADIYSLGLVMYRLLNGNRPPFVPLDIPAVSAQMQETANTRRFKGEMLPVPANVKSPELCTVVMKACEYRPENRWQNPEDMKDALIALKKAMKAPKSRLVDTAPVPTPKPIDAAPQTFTQASTAFLDQGTIPASFVMPSQPVQQPVSVSSQPMTVGPVKDTPVKKKSKKPMIFALIAVAALLIIGVLVIIGVTAGKKESETSGYTIVDSGSLGNNVTYELDENGQLVISGSGEMNSYGFSKDTPWEGNHDNIKTIIIKDGVTSIGSRVFSDCTNLTSITIPDSVTSIGDNVFNSCTSLTSITIPDSVTGIGNNAFSGCTSLTSITIPDSVTSIGGSAFYKWSSSQIIYMKGRSEAPSGWDIYWDSDCDAKIVWDTKTDETSKPAEISMPTETSKETQTSDEKVREFNSHDNLKIATDKITISPTHVYFDGDELVAECNVYNGYSYDRTNIQVNKLNLYDSSNTKIAGGQFNILKYQDGTTVTIEAKKYVTQTFRFSGDAVLNTDPDMSYLYWEYNVDSSQVKVREFYNSDSVDTETDKITVTPTQVFFDGDVLIAECNVYNGFSNDRTNIQVKNFILYDSSNTKFAGGTFNILKNQDGTPVTIKSKKYVTRTFRFSGDAVLNTDPDMSNLDWEYNVDSSKVKVRDFSSPDNVDYKTDKITVSPTHVYFDGDYLYAECNVYNGYSYDVTNINVKELDLSDSSNTKFAGGTFNILKYQDGTPATIESKKYVTWTFRFSGDTVLNKDPDMSTLYLYSNVQHSKK